MIQLILEFFLLRELENLAYKDFKFIAPRTVLSLLLQLESARFYKRLKTTGKSSSLDSILTHVWENAAIQAQANPGVGAKWREVMAVCNSMLCALIPNGAKDPYLLYLKDIKKARMSDLLEGHA